MRTGNYFSVDPKFLKKTTSNGSQTARYVSEQAADPPISKVMMNPPFALKRGSEKEYKFIDHALRQMQDGGTLFSVLPYPALARPGGYKTWRKLQLIPHHTVLAVVTLPIDLFYPVSVNPIGLFVRKGVPHDPSSKVLWIRALNDGLLKSKGKRLPNARAKNDLAGVRDVLRSYLDNPDIKVKGTDQFVKACPIDLSDGHVELVPEAYLDQAEPTHEEVASGMSAGIRDILAYLLKIGRAELQPNLIKTPAPTRSRPKGWKRFLVTDLCDLKRGHFHSIADLDPGEFPTISRVGSDNGLVGFYEKPEKAKVFGPGIISVSSVTGDAFVQPVPFIATGNVVLCCPKPEYARLGLEWLFFVQLILVLRSDTNMPGKGLFKWAARRGLFSDGDEMAFFARELRRVYDFWKAATH